MPCMAELLRVEGLSSGYGEAIVVQRVDFALEAGRSLALLGRNGTGKTTLLNTLVGVTRRHAGRIVLAGVDLTELAPHRRAAAGIGWVPQERNIFKSLTVHENLTAVARPGRPGVKSAPWGPERVYEMFPRLAERRGNLGTQLSGGEQQMLAIGRALVLNPRLLLLDEPLEGLAPLIVTELLRALTKVVRDEGLSAIFVEQNPARILAITDDAIVLERGTVVHASASAALAEACTTVPRSSTIASSVIARMRAGFCSTKMADRPSSRTTFVNARSNSVTMSGANPSSGSSSSSRRGLSTSARPIASICCSPPESCVPRLPRRSARRG